MSINYKLYLLFLKNHNISQIAAALSLSRTTVRRKIEKIKNSIYYGKHEKITEVHIQEIFETKKTTKIELNNFELEYFISEYAKKNVTLKLLWNEYCKANELSKRGSIGYSQFCKKVRRELIIKSPTLIINKKPGEKVEVDWAGSTISYCSSDDIKKKAYIFVAVLPFSNLLFAKAYSSMKIENWIQAHIDLFNFLGGIPKIIVCDNLKTGVIKSDRYEPQINAKYAAMAEHYSTTIIPTRIFKPKDKASVENTVKIITNAVIGSSRSRNFTSISEINDFIQSVINDINMRKVTNRRLFSRIEFFDKYERECLSQVNCVVFEIPSYSRQRVPNNYHIRLNECLYSVPYTLIGETVDIKETHQLVEVFHNHILVAKHIVKNNNQLKIHTYKSHMPIKHIQYLENKKDQIINSAKKIGENCLNVIETIFGKETIDEIAERKSYAILNLSKTFDLLSIESAIKYLITNNIEVSKANIKNHLNNKENIAENDPPKPFIRGAKYYER